MAYRVVITKPGGPKVLDIQEISIPEPKSNEICIAVHYAGINFADTLMRLGFYQPRPPFPFTPGYEVSGVVHSIGSGVEGFEVGQRVVGLMRTGGQASHVIADASRTLPIPDEISLESAASMPVTYITAHHMLHHLGNLKSTDSVLIHGGGGGVGTAALQLCHGLVSRRSGQLHLHQRQKLSNPTERRRSTDTMRILLTLSKRQPIEMELITSLTRLEEDISN